MSKSKLHSLSFFFHMPMEKALTVNQSIWGVEYHCPFFLGFLEDSIRLQSGITLTWVLCFAFSCLIRNGKYDSGLASAANTSQMHSYECAVHDCLQIGRQKEDFINPGAFKPISRRQNWQHYDWYKIILISYLLWLLRASCVLIPHSRSWKVRFNSLQKPPPQFSVKWERQQCSASEWGQKDECIKDYGDYNNPSRRDKSTWCAFIHHTLMDISGSFFLHFTSLNRFSSSPH